jgi:hypothetical protein
MVRASLRERFAPIPPGVPYVDWWLAMQSAAVSELEYLREPRVGYRQHGSNLTHNAQGIGLARERIKQTMTRRQTIIHGGAAALPAEAVSAAWAAVERDGLLAVQAAGSVFVDLPRASDVEREAAAAAAARARSLHERGNIEGALRCWLIAAAHDPFDSDARAAISGAADELAARHAHADPFDGARSFTVLADAAALSEQPQLLSAFAAQFGEVDDATLVIHAPGISPEETGEVLTGVLSAAGVDADGGADMLALPDPRGVRDAGRLARAADVLLDGDCVHDLRRRYEAAVTLTQAPLAPERAD